MLLTTAITRYGVLEGLELENASLFKGIPYASPPVGNQRFRPPLLPKSWEGIRKAHTFAPICPQPLQEEGSFYQKEFYDKKEFSTEMSEDCLYLNIWTPAKNENEKLPVAFWIHGGAFRHGWGHEKEFDGEAFCREGVILVTINYRVNFFGFLSHPWLEEEGNRGNFGLLDQIAALNWVYENIHAFGGDKDNITVMGQSAGAYGVQCLTSTPLTKGKIKKSIMQSGMGFMPDVESVITLEEANKRGEALVSKLGITSVEELREVPYEVLVKEVNGMFYAVIDDYVLSASCGDILLAGNSHRIPYLLGCTSNDHGTKSQGEGQLSISDIYHTKLNWVRIFWEKYALPSYLYYFSRNPLGDHAGAFHSSELWYMFGTLDRSWRPKDEADYRLSEQMVSYWCNFIKNGDPNQEGLPIWQPCENGDIFIKNLR